MGKDQETTRHPGAIPITAVTFKLTEEDIRRYWDEILHFPVEQERDILRRLPNKLKSLMTIRIFSSFLMDLVKDVELLYHAMANERVLAALPRKMILFALGYFIEIEDEIPDKIDILGYVDDAVVVRWVVNEISEEYPGVLGWKKDEAG